MLASAWSSCTMSIQLLCFCHQTAVTTAHYMLSRSHFTHQTNHGSLYHAFAFCAHTAHVTRPLPHLPPTPPSTQQWFEILCCSFEDVEKEACFILGLLAIKPEWQAQIAAAGALPSLVKLLKQHRITSMTKSQPGSGGVARRAADAITNLAHENVDIKNVMRQEGGIPPLVALLEAWDIKVRGCDCGHSAAELLRSTCIVVDDRPR